MLHRPFQSLSPLKLSGSVHHDHHHRPSPLSPDYQLVVDASKRAGGAKPARPAVRKEVPKRHRPSQSLSPLNLSGSVYDDHHHVAVGPRPLGPVNQLLVGVPKGAAGGQAGKTRGVTDN